MAGAGPSPASAATRFGLQPGADDQPVDGDRARRGPHDGTVALAADAGDPLAEPQPAPGRLQVTGHGPGDGPVVGDSGARRVQRGGPPDVRLDPGQLGRAQPAQPGDPVGGGPGLDVPQPRHLGRRPGDDHLADLAVGQVPRGAEPPQPACPLPAQPGLQGTGRVVNAGVHDAGVVPGLVHRDVGLLLEDGDVVAFLLGQPTRHGQADDSGADDADTIGHAVSASSFVVDDGCLQPPCRNLGPAVHPDQPGGHRAANSSPIYRDAL